MSNLNIGNIPQTLEDLLELQKMLAEGKLY